jgi:hypothetical protein
MFDYNLNATVPTVYLLSQLIIQSLESCQLDDLPAEGGNAAAKRLCATALQPFKSRRGRRTASTRLAPMAQGNSRVYCEPLNVFAAKRLTMVLSRNHL